MRKITLIIALAVSFMTGTARAAEWVNISGSVYHGSRPLSAMVLANGQHMFTDPADGMYNLSVPLNDSGEIILFSFCDGFASFRQVLTPQEAEHSEIRMAPVSPDSTGMSIKYQLTGRAVSGRVRISGTVLHDETPLCAVVLANGQHTFSCAGEGGFELEVPLNEKGEITLLGFCDGFAPFRHIVKKSEFDADNDGDGYSVTGWDCNDSDSSVHPGAAEICGDGTDQSCDGSDSDCGDPDFTLRGGVFDAGEIHNDTRSRVLIGGARVSLFPVLNDHETSAAAPVPITGLHTYANTYGAYEFSALPGGEYECNMVAEAEGYEQWESIINIVRGDNSQSADLMPALTCYENNECPGDMYCAKFSEDCDGKGMCSELFRTCTANWAPVCGCDGWTYSNACSAGAAGMNVAYAGMNTVYNKDACVPSPESGVLSGHAYEETAACAAESCVVASAQVSVTQILPPDSENLPRGVSDNTDKNGFYKFAVLPAGEYKMAVTRRGYKVWEGFVSITGGEEAVQDAYLTPVIAESVLRGHVCDGSVSCDIGERCAYPLAKAFVSIHYRQPDKIIQIPPEVQHFMVTDSDGYYEFPDLPSGEYDMSVSCEWYQIWGKERIIIDSEKVLDVCLMPLSFYR